MRMQDLLQQRQQLLQQAQQQRQRAQQTWNQIPQLARQALANSMRDWVALECLANEQAYAKPDTRKRFILWEARRDASIHIELSEDIARHPWVRNLFIQPNVVRFPFNPGDSSPIDSLSWTSIPQGLRAQNPHFYELPRFSTASRSNLALIPENLQHLTVLQDWPGADRRQERTPNDRDKVHVQEWEDLASARPNHPAPVPRFRELVPDPGEASNTGVRLQGNQRYRLYSIKTGVDYVGTHFEGNGSGNKHVLEANSSMAMLRSNVIRALRNRDDSFGVQTEILTITAPQTRHGRDGFQVRDLSCMWPRLSYLPGQAVPFARHAFDRASGEQNQREFWRKAFAIPLGRAKARLFLNYGLVHTSANAQNFLLGFTGHGLRQFVARDLGDTSWHDDYIIDHLRFTDAAMSVYRGLLDERASPVRHVLHQTSSGQYPAPHIVRLASYSVLTHRFDVNLGWSRAGLHHFATGIFDGFLGFIEECLGIGARYPAVNGQLLTDQEIDQLGVRGAYPHFNEQLYQQQIDQCLALTPAVLLQQAAWVRQRSAARMAGANTDMLRQALNAEELLLCAAVEKLLRTANKQQLRNRLQPLVRDGNWPAVVEW